MEGGGEGAAHFKKIAKLLMSNLMSPEISEYPEPISLQDRSTVT